MRAVLIDAALIRVVAVPAAMRLLGRIRAAAPVADDALAAVADLLRQLHDATVGFELPAASGGSVPRATRVRS